MNPHHRALILGLTNLTITSSTIGAATLLAATIITAKPPIFLAAICLLLIQAIINTLILAYTQDQLLATRPRTKPWWNPPPTPALPAAKPALTRGNTP